MWHFYLQCLKNDLFAIVPSSVAVDILTKVIQTTLRTLTVYYSNLSSIQSQSQLSITTNIIIMLLNYIIYRYDILSILLIVSNILPYINDPMDNTKCHMIHQHCTTLIELLTNDTSNVLCSSDHWQYKVPLKQFGICPIATFEGINKYILAICSLPYDNHQLVLKV